MKVLDEVKYSKDPLIQSEIERTKKLLKVEEKNQSEFYQKMFD